jgi:EAL domain-containing protein (putative c-di-GMP-specific phosphodiesterase class I)
MTPKLQRVLADFSAMRPEGEAVPESPVRAPAAAALSLVNEASAPRPAAARTNPPKAPASATTRAAPAAQAAASAPRPAVPTPRPAAAAAGTAPPAKAAVPAAPSRPSVPPAAATVASANGFANKRPQEAVTPEIDRLHAALRRSPIALHVQRLVPLTKGSQLKRYEVLLRSKSDSAPNSAPQAMLKAAVDNGLGSMIDRRVITELISYLVHHPDVWKSTAVMFSVNLTATALHDEHFIKFVELCLAKSSLPKGMIAFEVDTATAVKLADKMPDVAAALHRLGCPLVLDDFALKTECFALLRLPGVHYVKLAPEITAKMRTDKLSQAAITAVVQMARVLGMHTVAKRTENAAEQEWLTALGVDFVQSNSMSPPISIESLSRPASPARPVSPTA